MSVLFCDLVGFTASSEGVDPEDVHARMRRYYEGLCPVIEAFGGTVEKYIGDAVLAVFGAPVAHEDDPERAVRAGLAIVDAVQELNTAEPALGLEVRVGINTGEVLVTLNPHGLGHGEVLGDAVNTAARIQSVAPVGGVLVGESTFLATERVFDYEPLEPVSAKGKSAPVAVWQAAAPRARLGSDVIRSLTRPLVGRGLDLALLRGSFEKVVAEREVQLVTVLGEPGVGKSRLVAELSSYVDWLPVQVCWRRGRCLPYGDGITFWALGEVVKAHAGIYDSDSREVATGKLEAVLPDGEERPWLRERLLPLLGIESGEAAARAELFTAWRRFLESIAERGPLILVVEDIHWADPALIAFLEHLADWAQAVPLLIVCTARPELYERHPGWSAGLGNHSMIHLSPLSDADTATLVSALLDETVLPAETQRLLLDQAGGNPLYAEEFVRMLGDRDLLDEQGELRVDAEVVFPDSIQALIAARLDTIPQDRKHMLQDAAVIGRAFWAGSVAIMGEHELPEVEQALHHLSRKELVRMARRSSIEGEAEYVFWHALVRDVAYSQIPRAQRAAKHLAAASWLEGKAGERLDEFAEVLAYHTGEALSLAHATGDNNLELEVTPDAARYALLAGQRALGLDTNKALSLLERAKSLTPESDPLFALVLLRWGDAAAQAGRLREAAHALERAASTFEAQDDVLHAGEALSMLGFLRRRLGEPGYLTVLERAVALLEPVPGPELVAALTELAQNQRHAAAYDASLETAARAVDLGAELDLPVSGWALATRGGSRFDLGDPGGLADLEQGLELLIATGQGQHAAHAHEQLANRRGALDGTAAAVAQSEQAEAFARARGLTGQALQIRAAALVGGALIHTGRFDELLEQADELLPLLRESGNKLMEALVLASQAWTLAERGQDASGPAEQALQITSNMEASMHSVAAVLRAAIATGDTSAAYAVAHYAPPALLPAFARALAAAGDLDLMKSLAENARASHPIDKHALLAVRAIQLEHARDYRQAAAIYADAAERWEQFTNVLEHAYARLGQGRCLTLVGAPAAASPLCEARCLFEEMAARPRVSECERLIADAGVLSADARAGRVDG